MTERTKLEWIIQIIHMISPIKYPLILSTIGYLLASIITYNAIHKLEAQQKPNLSNNTTPSPNNITTKRPKNGQLSRSDSGSPASGEVVVTSTIIFPKKKKSPPNLNSPTNKGRSSGEYTRKYFYKLLLLALVTRLLFIQMEAASLLTIEYFNKTNTEIGDKQCSDNVICILSRTFPDYTFASALSLLVLFYGQLAGTASIGGPTGLSLLLSQNKHIYLIGNAIMYSLYTILFLLHVIFSRPNRHYVTYDQDEIDEELDVDSNDSTISNHLVVHTKEQHQQIGLLTLYIFQRCTWFLLLVVYGILLGLLAYFGPILVIVLRPSLAKWSGLALRLISMCILCTIIFITRMLSFAFACATNDIQYTTGFFASFATKYFVSSKTHSNIAYFFTRDVIGNVCYELIPTFIILFMMHSKNTTERRYPQSSSGGSVTPPTMPKQQPQYMVSSYNYNNAAAAPSNSSANFMRRNISGSAPKGVSTNPGGNRILMMHKNGGGDEIRPLLDHYPNKGYGL